MLLHLEFCPKPLGPGELNSQVFEDPPSFGFRPLLAFFECEVLCGPEDSCSSAVGCLRYLDDERFLRFRVSRDELHIFV